MDYSKLTLGELLSSDNQAVKRNAVGILKQLQKKINILDREPCEKCHDTQFYYDRKTKTMKLCENH